MGNQPSHQSAYIRLLNVIPAVWVQWGKDGKGVKLFNSDSDRNQFIHSVLSVISRNGELSVDEYEFRLLYARNNKDQLVATLVATKNGIITAKIEPPEGGSDHEESFKAFQRHVEVRLHELLQSIPDAATVVSSEVRGAASHNRTGGSTSSSADEPPSYVYVESVANPAKKNEKK